MSDEADDDEPENDPSGLFTSLHTENLNKAIEILDRTFDSYVLTYKVLSDDCKTDQFRTAYTGGRAEAIGMCEMAKNQLLDI
jgi:hypothetical protein